MGLSFASLNGKIKFIDEQDKDESTEIFYFYSKGRDFINIISLMNSLAFPGTVEPDFTAFGVNENLYNRM
jgi:hypothetical protein